MGGWTACSASGQNQYSEGYLWDSLVGLEVVLPTGEIVRTGLNAWSNCGPIGRYGATSDIQGLFLGSLGVFGVITETTYTIFPDHESLVYVDLGFEDWESLIQALKMFRKTTAIADVSMLDDAIGEMIAGESMKIPYPLILCCGCVGTKEEAERKAAITREIAAKAGAKDLGVPVGDLLHENAALINAFLKKWGGIDDTASVGHTFEAWPEIHRVFREVSHKYDLLDFWYAWVL